MAVIAAISLAIGGSAVWGAVLGIRAGGAMNALIAAMVLATGVLLIASAVGTWRVAAYGRWAALTAAGLGLIVGIGGQWLHIHAVAYPGFLYLLVLLILYNRADWRDAFSG